MYRPLCPVLLVSALLAAGCGSGSHGHPGSTAKRAGSALTQAAYGSRAGAILRPLGSKLAKLRVEMTRAGTGKQAQTEAGRVAKLATTGHDELAAISPPGTVAAQHRALVSELGALATQARALVRVAAKPPLSAFLARAAAFENAPIFQRLGATIQAIQSRGVDLGLVPTRS